MMNKLVPILIIFIIALLSLGIHSEFEENKILDKECQKLGYVEYTFKSGFKFCEDEKGNLDYVNYECKYKIGSPFLLLPESCSLNEITVGKVVVYGGEK